MGGPGSGSWWLRKGVKDNTENHYRIDIRWLKKQWLLWPDTSGTLSWSCNDRHSGTIGYKMETDKMMLFYNHLSDGGDWEPVEQVVKFDRTPCNYGGYRTWFFCPKCWKRVATLFGAGKYFFCRHCYDLTYASQQENKVYRLMRTARKMRRRLGASEVFDDPIVEKPRYMHWKTFHLLREKAYNASRLSWLTMGGRL